MKELTNILLAVVILSIIFNNLYKNINLTKVISSIDGRSYTVRKLPDKQEAADKLAVLSRDLSRLVDHVYKHNNDIHVNGGRKNAKLILKKLKVLMIKQLK